MESNTLIIKSLSFKDNLALYSRNTLEKADEMANEIGRYICGQEKEYLVLVCLTPQGLPLTVNVTNFASFENYDTFARDVLRTISLSGAGAFTILRNRVNNSTQNLKPSALDEKVTDYFVQLARASQTVIIDHIIVGNNNGTLVYYSYSEKRKKKLRSIGKTLQEMMGDFRIDTKSFPRMQPVTGGWEKETSFVTLCNKEESDVFFMGGTCNA